MSEYVTDEKTDQLLEEMKNHFNYCSKAETIVKAIALLLIAEKHEDSDGTITIRKNNKDTKIDLRH